MEGVLDEAPAHNLEFMPLLIERAPSHAANLGLPSVSSLGGWAERHARTLAFVLVIVATVRIVATWSVFSPTADECAHIACGMEWIDHHTYELEPQHPPLARIAVALGPYLTGARDPGKGSPSELGAAILADQGRLGRNLALARAGTLPFFWLACAVVFLWARRLLGPTGALVALLFFTALPPVLGHAGLATTDMALTGALGAAVLATLIWAEQPNVSNTVLLGCAGALAVLSKFSSLPFFASSMLSIAAWQVAADWRIVRKVTRRHIFGLAGASALVGVLVWGGYFFSYGTAIGTDYRRPAPEFFNGLWAVRLHNSSGHLAYLLGRFSQTGFREYYPVALGVKTPLAFLALLLVGAGACLAKWKEPARGQALAFSAGILGFAVAFSRINIGIRHVLPVYIGFSIVAAAGFLWLLQRRGTTWAGAVLAGWLVLSSAVVHPGYLSYFNLAGGSKPERILIDSDLDWGQDMKRLALRLQELQVPSFGYIAAIYPRLAGAAFPPMRDFDTERAAPGWYAAHITQLTLRDHDILVQNPGARFWVDDMAPIERIGGILLWRVSAAGAAAWNASRLGDKGRRIARRAPYVE